MRKDASLLCFFAAIAILAGVFAPSEPVQKAEPPPEEIRIGDVAEVAEIDPIKDANADKGWYRKTKAGWMFWPEKTVDESKPPNAELAAFMRSQAAESAAGLACIALPVALILKAKSRKKRKTAGREMKRITGVSQAEFQFLIRKLSGMEQILQNLMPEEEKHGRGGKR